MHITLLALSLIGFDLSRYKWIIPLVTSTAGIPEKYDILSGNSFNGTSSEASEEVTEPIRYEGVNY